MTNIGYKIKSKIKERFRERYKSKNNYKEKNIFIKTFVKNYGLERYEQQLIFIKDWTLTIVYALLLASVLKTFLYENFKIPSGSMNPLLLDGDRVLVNKWYYGYSKFSFPFKLIPIKERILSKHMPQRGDIIVFHTKFSEQNGIFYIKRIIGLPGDKVRMKNNQVYINNVRMDYKKIGSLPEKSLRNHNNFATMEYVENNGENKYNILIADVDSIAGNTYEYVVPNGYYFCEGDNRDNSHDSRFPDFGMVPYRNIVGKAERIFFSTANGSFNLDRIFANIQAKKI